MYNNVLNKILPALLILALALAACSSPQKAEGDAESTEQTEQNEQTEHTEKTESETIRILSTSDLHGKMYPWDYLLNEENTAGSIPQLLEADVRSDIGGIRDMIMEYITEVHDGELPPECDYNWEIIGVE